MASRTELRVFTIQEANRSIKDLRKVLPQLRKVLRNIERTEERLEILDMICNRSVTSDNPNLREYLELKVEYHRKISRFEWMLARLEEQGFLLRDLEKGIVHFLSHRGDESVLLCWKEGEKEISHWHALDDSVPDEDERMEIENRNEF